ncbi:MAG TPA: hypothetical protein VIL74_08885 [Pyrinomonadaceae bacterium]|jgi:hypothetical protein
MTQALQVRGAQSLAHNQQAQAQIAPALTREDLSFFANMIEAAGLIPQERDAPPAKAKARVMAKIVGGQVYGFDPIQAQENLHIINGKITLSARGMAQLLHRSGKYATRVERLDKDGCKLAVLERNEDGKLMLVGHVEFTRQMADAAGLFKSNPTWQKYAEDMYFARCISRVVKRFAPEVLDGQAIHYDLAKKEPEPVAPAPADNVRSIAQGAAAPHTETAVGEVYEDKPYQEYSGMAEAFADAEIEGEFVPAETASTPTDDQTDSPETLEALRKAAREALNNIGDAAELKKILKGRQIDMMSGDELRELLGDLSTF